MSNSTLSFLPWVRQGAASAIDAAPDAANPVASVSARLTLNQQAVPDVRIALRGPGDVIGIDANQVVRTDPRAGTTDFEPNCFPSIEFDRPDFPWLFTPTRPADTDRLRPWLCLVVVRKQPGVGLTTTADTPLPRLTIEAPAVPAAELPDLADSWAWAHAQVAADNTPDDTLDVATAAIDRAFAGGPELTLSRLVCPRFLEHDTEYVACVVPAFEVGRAAGIGQPIPESDTARWNLAPAWTLSPPPARVVLPVYYQWEFRTGQQGDFETLARRLTAGVPEGLGTRTIDISRPGFDASGSATLEMEGALLPVPVSVRPGPPPMPDAVTAGFKARLASIINPPAQPRASADTSDPLLAPPMYGQWHAARAIVDPAGTAWLDQLNLDPRWRVAAAIGTRVVQQYQEALIASAWEQAGQLQAANQRLRQMQLSMVVGDSLHARHISRLGDEMMLRVAAPAFGRLRNASHSASLLSGQTRSYLPAAANRSAMRRIGRQRGPLTRRVEGKGFARPAANTWVARMNRMWTQGNEPSPPPAPPPMQYAVLPPVASYTRALQYTNDAAHKPQSFYGMFVVTAERAPLTVTGPQISMQRSEAPDFFRSAVREHLSRVFPSRAPAPAPQLNVFPVVTQQVLDQTKPSQALVPLANAVIAKGDGVLAPTPAHIAPDGVETIMAAPLFPHPMYEALRELSSDLLLLGFDKVQPDTVLGLATNRRFVEAYMVGLNHELGRELLWRGFPTDQRGTYFDHFWGNGTPNTAPADITDLETWSRPDPVTHKLRQLGDASGGPVTPEDFVLVLRSSLLRRYPNAVIYLAPARRAGAGAPNPDALVPDVTLEKEKQPSFTGSAPPDVTFFGFPVTSDQAIGRDGGLGYYVIIQEHPTEPRFGVDDDLTRNGTHLRVTPDKPDGLELHGGQWNTNAAQMARITRRLPVRMAIHAARLITPA